MRTRRKHKISEVEGFKRKLLAWAQQFEDVVWLDSNDYYQKFSEFDAVLAVDALTCITTDCHNAFDDLKDYQSNTKDWIFGYLTYDLKNDIEALKSQNFDGLQFPDLYFFQPKKLFFIKGDRLITKYLNMVEDEVETDLKAIEAIKEQGLDLSQRSPENPVRIKLRIHKDDYFAKLERMLDHIHKGDIYEANFCQEFYAEDVQINPLETYWHLNHLSKPPFATFLKAFDKYLLSASPERFLKKKGKRIISQPIKGTAKRSDDAVEDDFLKEQLSNSPKERSENIMIVDLVRNDLSRTAKKGSVKVQELCRVYTFNQVHQMVSTVVAKIKRGVHPVDIIKTTFPMGSMTGAPKISAMKIIEELEETKRGLYSGAVGYFTPKGDFDFNVIIRSIL